MRGIYSFICGISEFIMNISKKTYRTCAIITTGACVVSVVAFASHHFGGGGKSNGYGSSGIVVYAADKSDADWQTIIGELQDVLEAQSENLQVCSEKEVKENIPEKAAIDIDVVMTADEGFEEEKESEEPEKLKADSIVTTSGVAIEGVMNAPIEVTEEEYNILLHIVAAEAGGCDVYGQILVANVIFNRVNNERFPDTIEEVVFQKNQFSPATKGTLWRVDINETTVEAVDRALSGEDYSCGALFFVARKRVSENTFDRFNTNYSWLFEHDGHDFFKFR